MISTLSGRKLITRRKRSIWRSHIDMISHDTDRSWITPKLTWLDSEILWVSQIQIWSDTCRLEWEWTRVDSTPTAWYPDYSSVFVALKTSSLTDVQRGVDRRCHMTDVRWISSIVNKPQYLSRIVTNVGWPRTTFLASSRHHSWESNCEFKKHDMDHESFIHLWDTSSIGIFRGRDELYDSLR